MPYPKAILLEAQQLHGVSDRLNTLSDEHPHVSEELLIISGNVRTIATSLELLVVAKAQPPFDLGTAND
jgi:hypothetical protein